MSSIQIGTEISGYQIIRPIGKGAMGYILLAKQVSMGRLVALKILNPALVEKSPGYEMRFTAEAQAAGKLSHPNIISVHDVGKATVNEQTFYYFSMEYIDGQNLGDYVQQKGPLGDALLVRVMASVLGALQYAHKRGMIHRDIKPDNIMITKDGQVKLADFGLALQHDSEIAFDYDQSGKVSIAGTPDYMPPELIAHQEIDVRADLYSLGATLHLLLTGSPPYAYDKKTDLLDAHVNKPVPDPRRLRDCPDVWAEMCQQLMAKKPQDRPAMTDLVGRTKRILRSSKSIHGGELVTKKPLPPRPTRSAARKPQKVIAKKPAVPLMVASIGLAIVATSWAWAEFSAPSAPTHAPPTEAQLPTARSVTDQSTAPSDADQTTTLRQPSASATASFAASPSANARPTPTNDQTFYQVISQGPPPNWSTHSLNQDAFRQRVQSLSTRVNVPNPINYNIVLEDIKNGTAWGHTLARLRYRNGEWMLAQAIDSDHNPTGQLAFLKLAAASLFHKRSADLITVSQAIEFQCATFGGDPMTILGHFLQRLENHIVGKDLSAYIQNPEQLTDKGLIGLFYYLHLSTTDRAPFLRMMRASSKPEIAPLAELLSQGTPDDIQHLQLGQAWYLIGNTYPSLRLHAWRRSLAHYQASRAPAPLFHQYRARHSMSQMTQMIPGIEHDITIPTSAP